MSGSKYQQALSYGRKALAKNRFAVAAATAVAAMWSPGAHAQVGTSTQIGIDLNTGRGEVNTLAPTDVAGAPNYRQNNWNMLTGAAGTATGQTFTTVNPTTGVTSSVTLSMQWASANTWSLSTNAPTTGDTRMMNGYLDSNGNQTLTNDLTLAQNQPYLTISGLSGEFLNGYKVILYADGDSTGGRVGQYWVTTFSGNLANVGGETELTSRVFVRDSANFSGTAYTQVPITSNTGAGASAGNYVVFDGLQAPNIVIRAEEFNAADGTPRAPINGIQIVASPTLPTDQTEWALAGGGDWMNAGSWLGGVPNGTSYSANFLSKATGPAAVSLNTAVQVKKLQFNNANPYTISGSGSITVNPNSGLGSVSVLSGNHSILVPLNLSNTTTFDIAGSSSLTTSLIDAGAQLISKEGAGTWVINSANKWGTLSVNNGTVRVNNVNVLNAGTLSGGATGTVDVNGFSQNIPRLEGAVNITNSKANTVNVFLNPVLGIQNFHTGAITGPINLDISGMGLQGLGGPVASTYTGTTTIGDYTTIRTTGNTAFGATNAGTVLNQGVILQVWNADLGFENFTIQGQADLIRFTDRGTIRGSITYGGGYTDLVIDANSGAAGSAISLLGDISGNIHIGKIGAQGLILGGHNTFTQGLNVGQGWLGIASNSDATAGPVGPVSSALELFNVGIRSIGGNHSISNPVNIIPTTELTVDPDPAGGTNVGVLTFTGPISLSDRGNPGTRRITTNADIVFAGKVSGGGIVKAGNGTLVLANNTNDFSGGLTLLAGKVAINDNLNLGPASQFISFQGGMIQVLGTTVTNLDSREANINYGSFSGGFDIAAPTNTFTVRAPMSGSGFFRKDGAGTLLMTGTNSYTGGTIVNGGVLRPVNSGSLPDNSAMTVNGGLLDLNGFSKTFTSLNGTGGAIGNGTGGNLSVTVGSNNASGDWAGALQNGAGAGITSLTKTGTGTQILRGASTYTGATAVNAGTLEVDGSLANTAVTVANNATLSGSGTIAGPVTIQSGGTIAPLATALNVGNLTLSAGSKLTFLLGASTTSSLINVMNPNGLALSGGAITLSPAPGVPGNTYDLIRYSGTHVGTLANLSLATPNIGDTTYTLFDDPGRAIGIVVGTSLLTWTGAANGNWDTTSSNWQGGANVFANGRNVRFDDTGTATTINVAAPVAPGRIDLFNVQKDYTFTGAGTVGGAGTLITKQGAGKAIFNQPLTNTGATVINSGVLQLNGPATLNQTSGITLNNTGSNPVDNSYPLTQARGGTLYLNDNSVADRLGSVPVTMNGGTIVALKGAPNGAGTTTVQNVIANSAMSRLIAAPSGGTHTLVVNNLTRAANSTATMDFRSAFGTLGATGDNGAIKLNAINGAAPALNNGLIGAWATAGDNFASYDPANGVIGNATNLSTTLVDGPTLNVRDTSATNMTAAGSVTVNSLISGADVIMPTGSTLTINSGAAMMSGPNKWWQGNGSFIRAGAGVSQMVFTVLDGGNDHRLRNILQDNGTPLTFIKNGDGYLNLSPVAADGSAGSNTYTGPTIVNAGTLAIRTAGALGSGTSAVTVRPGATFDLGGQNIGIREVIISGAGVSTGSGTAITTVGALTNTFADQTNAVIRLTMTGDATIGGGNRWDLRTQGTNLATLNGGTFTLTKVGTNNISIVAPGQINVGNIVVNQGQLSFENGNNIMGSTVHTITVNTGGTLAFWNNIAGGITQNKPLVLNGGIVSSDNGPTQLTGPVALTGPATGQLRANQPFTITNVVSGTGGFTKTGGSSLLLPNVNSYSGPTNVNAGTLRVTGSIANSVVTVNSTGTFEAPVTQRVKGLVVNTGGIVQVQPPALATARNVLTVGDGTSVISPFSVPGSGTNAGRINLDRNGLVVDIAAGGEALAQASVRDAIRPAFNNGTWTGNNGLSSALVTQANRLALGYGLVNEVAPVNVPGGQFFGVPVDTTSVIVRTTISGDANLDFTVNFDDLLALAKNYNQTSTFWTKGDFTYDGTVNFDDLLTLAKNYNQSTSPAPVVPGASAEFNADVAAAFAAAVPEPTGLGLLGLAGAALMGGRRRRNGSK